MDSLLNKNKRRLYIAFYDRGRPEWDTDMFHDSLLLLPKLGREETSWIYHATNSLSVQGLDGLPNISGRWVYQGTKTRGRTVRLRAIMFLGKVKKLSGEDIDQLLATVPVVQSEDNPHWKCHDWTKAAIEKLIEAKVIPQPSISTQTIWDNGTQFATQSPTDFTAPVPTCDIYGSSIESGLLDLLYTPALP